MSEKCVFLNLDDRHWEFVAAAAAKDNLTIEDWISKFIKDAVAEGVPTMKSGSAKTDLPNSEQVKQIARGIDKHKLIAAFVREQTGGRRLYFKKDGDTVPTYAHVIIGIAPGGRSIWDARGQWIDIQQMVKDMVYEMPGIGNAVLEIVSKR